MALCSTKFYENWAAGLIVDVANIRICTPLSTYLRARARCHKPTLYFKAERWDNKKILQLYSTTPFAKNYTTAL